MKHTGKLFSLFSIALVITLCLLIVSGCGANPASAESTAASSYSSYDSANMAELPEAAVDGKSSGTAENGVSALKDESALEQEAQSTAGSTLNRKIIKTVNIYIETQEFDKLIAALQENTLKFGGFVETSSVSGLGINQKMDDTYTPARKGYITVRIPTDKLNEFTTVVGDLGNVTQKDENSQDITLTYADTESRKKALEVEYERLLVLLEKAESLETVVALESRLSDVRYQLDNYSSDLRRYDSLVDYSTVSIQISEVKRFTPRKVEKQGLGERISVGVQETWLDIRDSATDFLVWFIVNLPYLLFFAAIVVLIVFLIRRSIKKSRAKKAALPRYPVYPQAPQGFVPPAPPVQNQPTPEKKDEKQ